MQSKIGVFVPEATNALFQHHFNRCWLSSLIEVYTDSQAFKQSVHERKIACFQMPYPAEDSFHNTVTDLLETCDHILILMSELHDRTVAFCQQHDNAQISYFICGEFNFELAHSPVHKFYDWFTTTCHFYKHRQPELLKNTLHPYDAKPKAFDALLGRKKPHRDIAYNRLIDKGQHVVSYLNSLNNCDFTDPAKWIPETIAVEGHEDVKWTVDRVKFHGYGMSVSQIIPFSVYNQTAYSLVAETNFSNHYSFYTEKTVKPILAQRLFVLLSGQYALRNLRAIGFQTFDGIIDESYDLVADYNDRCSMALDQVEWLAQQPQEEIFERIKPICDHNQSLMLRTSWYDVYFIPEFVNYFKI